MSNRFVKDGTRTDYQPRLCDNCRCATVIKGAADSQEFIHCNQMGPVKIRVIQCNRFVAINELSIYEMELIAWKIEKKSGGRFGLEPPRKESVNVPHVSDLQCNPLVQRLGK